MKTDNTSQGIDRIQASERDFHDRKAELEAARSVEDERDLKTTIYALKVMGLWDGVNGKSVLECACGTGKATVLLAGRAASVTGFDISPESVRAAESRAQDAGLENVTLNVSAMESLPYADASFDVVVGFFILHHLADLAQGIREVSRVLKPGGRAVFLETSAGNRVLMFCRRNLAGRWRVPKLGTETEHPLTGADLESVREAFDGNTGLEYPYFRFFGKFHFQLTRRWAGRSIFRWTEAFCEGLDRLLYRCCPFFRRYSYFVVLSLARGS